MSHNEENHQKIQKQNDSDIRISWWIDVVKSHIKSFILSDSK